MKDSIKKGFSYGVTSGVITTLGLMVGLNASTHSQLVVVGGVCVDVDVVAGVAGVNDAGAAAVAHITYVGDGVGAAHRL